LPSFSRKNRRKARLSFRAGRFLQPFGGWRLAESFAAGRTAPPAFPLIATTAPRDYFDASYLVRLYFEAPGWEAVRALAATVHVACCIHGQVEAVAAFHRKLREGALTPESYRELRKQFDSDCAAGGFHWLPFSERLAARVVTVSAALPSVHLRARSMPVSTQQLRKVGGGAKFSGQRWRWRIHPLRPEGAAKTGAV
jgi:hypothetical protein